MLIYAPKLNRFCPNDSVIVSCKPEGAFRFKSSGLGWKTLKWHLEVSKAGCPSQTVPVTVDFAGPLTDLTIKLRKCTASGRD